MNFAIPKDVGLKNALGTAVNPSTEEKQDDIITNQSAAETLLQGIAGFTIEGYDYISLGYTGDNLTTVVYKSGGSGGTTIATLTLAYTGDVLDSITKS